MARCAGSAALLFSPPPTGPSHLRRRARSYRVFDPARAAAGRPDLRWHDLTGQHGEPSWPLSNGRHAGRADGPGSGTPHRRAAENATISSWRRAANAQNRRRPQPPSQRPDRDPASPASPGRSGSASRARRSASSCPVHNTGRHQSKAWSVSFDQYSRVHLRQSARASGLDEYIRETAPMDAHGCGGRRRRRGLDACSGGRGR
jgi:hypothetical protein